jgi:hypothetical protein
MPKSFNKVYWNFGKGLMALTVGILVILVILSTVRYAFEKFFESNAPKRFRSQVFSPIEEFEKVTGLTTIPSSTQIIIAEDTHGGLQGDGTICIALKVKHDVLGGWTNNLPPWSVDIWGRGPVPSEIGVNCSMQSRPLWTISDSKGAKKYGGDQQLRELLESQDIWYVAKNRGPSTIPWHNGNLLVIDTKTDTAWLFVWDM